MYRSNKLSQAGYSFIEMLISIALSSILLITTLNLVFTLMRTSQNNQALTEIHGVSTVISNELTQALRWAKNVVISENRISMDLDSKHLEYEVIDGNIYINDVKVNPDTVTVDNLIVSIRSPSGSPTLYEIRYTFRCQNQSLTSVKVISTHRGE